MPSNLFVTTRQRCLGSQCSAYTGAANPIGWVMDITLIYKWIILPIDTLHNYSEEVQQLATQSKVTIKDLKSLNEIKD